MITSGLSRTLKCIGRMATRPAFNRSVVVLAALIVPIAGASFVTPSASPSRAVSTGRTLVTPAESAPPALSSPRVFVSAIRRTGKAELSADKNDYAPGDRVILAGPGWRPRESVRLRVHRNINAPDEFFTVRADSTGRFRSSSLMIKKSDLGVAFVVTATGRSSKYLAEVTFTDGNITVKSSYPNSIPGHQTFTLTKTIVAGSNVCSGCGTKSTVTGVNSSTGNTFVVGNGDSVLLSAPQLSDQNGSFVTWTSPTMTPFTVIPDLTGRNIC